jgi:hypothetical protein
MIMQSSGKPTIVVTSSGVGVSRATMVVFLALGLFIIVLGVLCVSPAPSRAARGQPVVHSGNSVAPVAGFTGAGSSPMSTGLLLGAAGQASAASSGTVIVNLNPSSSSVAKDDVFTVTIQIVAGAQPVDSVQISLYFDQTYLQVVDTDSETPGVQIEDLSQDQFGWVVVANTVHTEVSPAWIVFASAYLSSGTKPDVTFSLAQIRFKALLDTGGGSTPLTFSTGGPTGTDVYYGLDSVLGGVENGSVTIRAETPTATPTMRTAFLPIVLRRW